MITKASFAAELGISKARISQYVAEGLPVRSDGKLDRENALNWIACNHSDQTGENRGVGCAIKLSRDKRQPQHRARRGPVRHGEPDPVLETMVRRVRDWRELRQHGSGGVRLPIDVAATLFAGGDRSAVRTWLRAGLPYVEAGNWETGEGFVLSSSWTIDWGTLGHGLGGGLR